MVNNAVERVEAIGNIRKKLSLLTRKIVQFGSLVKCYKVCVFRKYFQSVVCCVGQRQRYM